MSEINVTWLRRRAKLSKEGQELFLGLDVHEVTALLDAVEALREIVRYEPDENIAAAYAFADVRAVARKVLAPFRWEA